MYIKVTPKYDGISGIVYSSFYVNLDHVTSVAFTTFKRGAKKVRFNKVSGAYYEADEDEIDIGIEKLESLLDGMTPTDRHLDLGE